MFRKIKMIGGYVFSIISLYSLIYYSFRFYIQKYIEFTQNDMTLWNIVCSIITLSLMLGIYNIYKNNVQLKKLEKQTENIELLINLARDLSKNSEENYDNICHYIRNNRELILEIFDELEEK